METYPHEWLCQSIVDNTQEAIIFADCEGMIRLWNRGAETIFRYTAAEVLGTSLELLIPERLRDRHRQGFRRVIATGVTKYNQQLLAVAAIRKDGARVSSVFIRTTSATGWRTWPAATPTYAPSAAVDESPLGDDGSGTASGDRAPALVQAV